jgi:hypothetical protein
MNNQKHSQRRKRPFKQMGLIFYCYLLIPLNELARNSMTINKIKNAKKFIVIINRSIGNAGKGVFCHLDEMRTRRLASANLIAGLCPTNRNPEIEWSVQHGPWRKDGNRPIQDSNLSKKMINFDKKPVFLKTNHYHVIKNKNRFQLSYKVTWKGAGIRGELFQYIRRIRQCPKNDLSKPGISIFYKLRR